MISDEELEYVLNANNIAMGGNRLREMVAELLQRREESRWIKCSERLPENNNYVLACNFNLQTVAELLYDATGWHIPLIGNHLFNWEVTHWQPLPASPEVEK